MDVVYHIIVPHGNSLAVGVIVLLDVGDDGLHFEDVRVAHVIAGGQAEGVGVAGLAGVGVVSRTGRGERLPGSLILPHLQEAGAHVQAGAAIRGTPGDEHVALHQRREGEGEGGRRGIANHGKAHAAFDAGEHGQLPKYEMGQHEWLAHGFVTNCLLKFWA